MTTQRHPARRVAAIAVSAVLAVALAACGEDEPRTEPTTTAASDSPEDDATAAYQRYWDVYVQLANSGEIDPAAFSGVAEGPFVESDLKKLRDQADDGLVRVGSPDFSDYRTTVDGDSATSLVCRDDTPWGAKTTAGETLPPLPEGDPFPYQATLERRADSWVVVDVVEKGDASCP